MGHTWYFTLRQPGSSCMHPSSAPARVPFQSQEGSLTAFAFFPAPRNNLSRGASAAFRDGSSGITRVYRRAALARLTAGQETARVPVLKSTRPSIETLPTQMLMASPSNWTFTCQWLAAGRGMAGDPGDPWRGLAKAGQKRFMDRELLPPLSPTGMSWSPPIILFLLLESPTWPINLEDLQTAVGWIRSNAGTFHINSGEIVAMGESAGANLANLLGTGSPSVGISGPTGPDAVEAVVSFSSPTDLIAMFNASPQAGAAAAQFLGGTPSELPQSYIAASPVDQVSPGDPPTFPGPRSQ